MKVASFNVNGVRARLQIVLDWLTAEQPDIVCAQETKVQDKDFPAAAFEEVGYHVAFQGQKSYNGVAIFTREPLDDVQTGFLDGSFAEDARLIAGRLGDVHIVNTYVPQGQEVASEKFEYKLAWLAKLREEFAERFTPTDTVLWMGDVNIARDARDLYDPEAFAGEVSFHPDEHKALDAIMEWGFTDIFRKHVEDDGEYSFFDYRLPNALKRNLGWRVDHIMATASLAETSVRAWIDREPRALEKPSDHTPICAEFDL